MTSVTEADQSSTIVDADAEARLIELVHAGDPGARDVYADWLEKHGRVDQAMMLRGPGGPASALTRLANWLHELGVLDGSLFQISADAAALGVGSAPCQILPGTEAVMTVRPQRAPFRPVQLVVPDDLAPHFVITDVKVGNRSQLEGVARIPASLFTATSAEGHRGKLRFEVVTTAMDFSIAVENTSLEPRSFFALVFGQTLDRTADVAAHYRALRGNTSAAQMADIVARVRVWPPVYGQSGRREGLDEEAKGGRDR